MIRRSNTDLTQFLALLGSSPPNTSRSNCPPKTAIKKLNSTDTLNSEETLTNYGQLVGAKQDNPLLREKARLLL